MDIRTRIGAIIPIAAAAVVGSYQSTEYRRVDADLLAKAASSAHASTAMPIEKISERHVGKTLPMVGCVLIAIACNLIARKAIDREAINRKPTACKAIARKAICS